MDLVTSQACSVCHATFPESWKRLVHCNHKHPGRNWSMRIQPRAELKHELSHWTALHQHAVVHASRWKTNAAVSWFAVWTSRIPNYGCVCQKNFAAYCEQTPPEFSSADAFFVWTVAAHNYVSLNHVQPRKLPMTVEDARQRYRLPTRRGLVQHFIGWDEFTADTLALTQHILERFPTWLVSLAARVPVCELLLILLCGSVCPCMKRLPKTVCANLPEACDSKAKSLVIHRWLSSRIPPARANQSRAYVVTKVVFIHVPRTGGTVLTDVFGALPWVCKDVLFHKHAKASVAKRLVGPIWKDAIKFAIERPEEEIAVSWYNHIQRYARERTETDRSYCTTAWWNLAAAAFAACFTNRVATRTLKFGADLRDTRKEIANREGVPNYTIFTDQQLADIVTERVHSKSDFSNIKGVGRSRIDKFGEEFLETIREFDHKDDETSELLPKILDWNNLQHAVWRAAKGERHRTEVQRFLADCDRSVREIQLQLSLHEFPFGRYRQFRICDSKPRTISAPSFPERVVHHSVIAVCEPHFERFLIDQTFACRVGKGRIAAIEQVHQYSKRPLTPKIRSLKRE